MTIEVYLDPSILSIPNMGQSPEEAASLLKRVEEISDAISMRLPVRIISTYNIYDDVGVSYPNVEILSEFLEVHNLDNYSANDLHKAFTIIFDKIEDASDDIYGEVLDGAFLEGALDCNNLGNDVPNSFYKSLLTCSLRRFGGANSFLLLPFVSDVGGEHYMECQAHSIARDGKRETSELSYGSEVFIINSLAELESEDVALGSWKKSKTEADILCSIWFGARAAMKERGDRVVNPKFSLGTNFFKSLASNEASGTGRFAQITAKFCFSAAAGYQDANLGEVRFSGSRARDQAVPLRAQLNTGNTAKRIMVWRLSNSSLEFANVGPKNELKIEVGAADCLCI